MRIAATIAEVRAWRSQAPEPVGLVPTMGYLHSGHRSLVERARSENRSVAVSLFVNPTQFGPQEDLASYPRDFERDRDLLEAAGCDLLFAPQAAELYPAGCETRVDVGSVATPLEGARRPGHFAGVATIVLKLLNIVRPRKAYFGQKDAQQLRVIQRMVRDLDLDVEIVACPTVREPDGLAMSIRNTYLDPAQRAAATVLIRALRAVAAAHSGGERDAERLRQGARRVLDAEPLARTDYVSVADATSLAELDRVEGPALASLAVHVGRARLIDNLLLDA